MRINSYILALTLAASTQVLAQITNINVFGVFLNYLSLYQQEITLGVWHKLSDHESYEKRGEITFNSDDWFTQLQIARDQAATPPPTQSSRSKQRKQKQQQPQQQPLQNFISYKNAEQSPAAIATFAEDFVLNVQAPIKPIEPEEPPERYVGQDGQFMEPEDEYEQRFEEWKERKAEAENGEPEEQTPGSYAIYQIKLRDEVRGWEAMSSIKSCLLVASDFQEKFTLHLDQDRQVYAFDYYTANSQCESAHLNEYPMASLEQFKSVSLDISTSELGPKPHFIRAQAIKLDQTGKPEAEQTFFQKYWFYVVPFLLIMVFTGGEPEKTAA
ncbi:hypothetical protein BGZ76_006710 [Entomortierella beljakovae]|nr:hypothetical protein BGZ76_006710 [Entomortierella beljakovae]